MLGGRARRTTAIVQNNGLAFSVANGAGLLPPCGAHGSPSIPRTFFLDPLHRDLYRNWDELARIHIGYLRLTSGR